MMMIREPKQQIRAFISHTNLRRVIKTLGSQHLTKFQCYFYARSLQLVQIILCLDLERTISFEFGRSAGEQRELNCFILRNQIGFGYDSQIEIEIEDVLDGCFRGNEEASNRRTEFLFGKWIALE